MTSLALTPTSNPALQTIDRYSSMNCVTVLARVQHDRHPTGWDVYWRVGKQRQGICRTTIDPALKLTPPDQLIVAELTTMQWLLEERDAAGNMPDVQRTLLIFSGGAPAKLASGKSDKIHLYPYAMFLKTRFAGATILAEQDSAWILPRAQSALSDHHIHGPGGECLTLPGIGPVWLTNHVMQQFRIRLNNQPEPQTWKVLAALLTTRRLQPLPESKERVELDAQRHRTPAVRLYDAQSRWVFVLANVHGRPTLTTAYIKR